MESAIGQQAWISNDWFRAVGFHCSALFAILFSCCFAQKEFILGKLKHDVRGRRIRLLGDSILEGFWASRLALTHDLGLFEIHGWKKDLFASCNCFAN